jgi:hypothetical protein
MITISITPVAFAAIGATMPEGFKAQGRPDGKGSSLIRLPRGVLDRRKVRPGPGESYSDVILRLAAAALRLSLSAIGGAWRSMRSGCQRGRLVSRFIKKRLARFREHVPRLAKANSQRELARSLLEAPWDKSAFNSQYAVKTRGAFRENQGDRASIAHRSPDRSRSPL